MMPAVMPDSSTAGLPRALAIIGTKGGEQMAATEVTMKVSASIRNNRHSSACRQRLPTRAPARNSSGVKSTSCSWVNRAMEATVTPNRSEEHTSELQSRENLVCRLPLEKKNTLTMKGKIL